MNTQQPLPVGLSDRSAIPDILRGFALLGILMDNIIGFTGWGFLAKPQREALAVIYSLQLNINSMRTWTTGIALLIHWKKLPLRK